MRPLAALPLAFLLAPSAASAQMPGQPGAPTYGAPTYGAPGAAPGGAGTPGPRPNGGKTERDLRRAEQFDSGRGLEWFYLGAEGGIFWLGADTLSKSGGPLLTGGKQASGVGPGGGIFLGGRLYTLNVGARARTAWLPDSQFLSVGGEVGLRLPYGNLEPYFWLGGGYAALLGVKERVRGFDVVLGGGVAYYLSNHFSLGGLASVELVSLGRPAFEGSPKSSQLGLAVVGSAVLGLHF